jgi:phytoene dehydrogenase-like protein
MDKIKEKINKSADVAVIGSGMGSLTAACLLAKSGQKVLVLEQNYLPGGCTSAYFRQGYIFEAGATTLVGLDPHMPLRHVLDELGLELGAMPLEVPMRVHLPNGAVLTRWRSPERWIAEAERVFGPRNQRAFWEECLQTARFVWETSLQQRVFPPSSWRDLWPMARNFRPGQVFFAAKAFRSMKDMLRRHDLLGHRDFVAFVDEQLLITAQNHHAEVNVLFGATALCYTLFGNYYQPGGLIHLARPFVEYLSGHGGEVLLRTAVEKIAPLPGGGYLVHTDRGEVRCRSVLSGIPLNNTLELFDDASWKRRLRSKEMGSPRLNSALQLGIGFERSFPADECLHHQILLADPLPETGSRSIFLSLSHPDDVFRAPRGHGVASISTHLPDPAAHPDLNKQAAAEYVLDILEEKNFLRRDGIRHLHVSSANSWESWTRRKYGFVGGYPQYMSIKPWEMVDARLDGKGAYLCGDTAYPGQGIPGVALSGIVAYEKMRLDGLGK